MASYLSKPNQYAPYQPIVDADLYGKLLMKKEADYQAGVQKIDKTLQYVASLPVSNLAEKDYLQQKINGITAKLNESVNTDWSKLSVQQVTSKHIADIANDKNIQVAAYNASQMQKDADRRSNDIDEYGESALTSNINTYDNKYNNWYSNGKVGEKINFKYTSYFDLHKKIKDYLKDLHPRTEVTENIAGAGRADMYDKMVYEVSGIDPSVVQKEVKAFLDSTPGAREQMNTNAEWEYRNFNAIDFAKKRYEITQQKMLTNDIEAQRLSTIMSGVNDSELKNKYNDKITALAQANFDMMPFGKYDFDKDIKDFNENEQSIKNTLYDEQFVNGIVDMYSYGGTFKATHSGDSPWKKTKEQERLNLMYDRNSRDAEMFKLKSELLRKKLDAQNANVDIPDFSTKGPIEEEDKTMAYANYKNNVETQHAEYTQQQIDFLATKLKQSKNNFDFYTLFDHNPNDPSHYIIKDVKLIPGLNIPATDYFLKGYTTTDPNTGKQVFHKGVINDWLDRADSGQYGKDEKGWELTNSDIQTLRQIRQRGQESEAAINQLVEMQNVANRDPDVKAYTDNLKRIGTIVGTTTDQSGHKITAQYNANDIDNYFRANAEFTKRYNEEIKNITGDYKQKSIEYQRIANRLEDEIYSKYKLLKNQVAVLSTSKEVNQLSSFYSKSVAKTDEILNREAIDRGWVFQPSTTRWTMNYKKDDFAAGKLTNQTIYDAIKNHVNTKYGSIDQHDSRLAAIFKNKNPSDRPQVDITWDDNKKQYRIDVSDVQHGKANSIIMNEAEAARIHVPLIAPKEDHIFRIMKVNGGSTIPANKDKTFETAQFLANIGPYEYRVHIITNSNGTFTIQPYRMNTQNKNAKPVTLPDLVTQTTDYDNVNKYLERLIYGTGANKSNISGEDDDVTRLLLSEQTEYQQQDNQDN